MSYDDISKACESLSYRDKFRLAQLLIQLGRKQEEEEYPVARETSVVGGEGQLEYVAERLLKLRPAKLSTLSNSISAMFQFQGGISMPDRDAIINELKKQQTISVSETGRVSYPE